MRALHLMSSPNGIAEKNIEWCLQALSLFDVRPTPVRDAYFMSVGWCRFFFFYKIDVSVCVYLEL